MKAMLADEPREEIVEGRTILVLPKNRLTLNIPPKSPVFYNPKGRTARDISIILYKAIARLKKVESFADSLTAAGARGIRVANEVPEINCAYMNDLNPIGLKYAQFSVERNKVEKKCSVSQNDVCRFLLQHSAPDDRFDIVDIDPFGSPAPYLDCAMRAVKTGGILSVTGTDTTVLCGLYPLKSLRRYGGISLRTEYCSEVGARLIISAAVKVAARLELAAQPIFSHVSSHYTRIYFQVSAKTSIIDCLLNKIGFIVHCFGCGNRVVGEAAEEKCSECSSKTKVAGPLWVGSLCEKEFVSEMEKEKPDGCSRLSFKLIDMASEEIQSPTFYDIDEFSARLHLPSVVPSKVTEILRRMGYKTSRTIFHPKGIRTDASARNFSDAVRLASRHQLF